MHDQFFERCGPPKGIHKILETEDKGKWRGYKYHGNGEEFSTGQWTGDCEDR